MITPMLSKRAALLAILSSAAEIGPVHPVWAEGVGASLAALIEPLDREAARLATLSNQPMTRIGLGPTLRPGDAGERVALMAQRLVETGFLPAEARSRVYTPVIAAAVMNFQVNQGLRPDGLVGESTRFAMDQDPRATAIQIRRSADEMRLFQATAPESYLLVNLPSQTVTLIRNNRVNFTMRAAVGRPSRETPLLQDQITDVIINPTWTVPPTILRQDKLPNLRRTGSPGIVQAAIYVDGTEVAPEAVDWQSISASRVRIVQAPGDHNALGRFRFNLTNSQNIYLHDTNDPKVFGKDLRAVSSGCVRLEEARRLAELLLAEVGIGPDAIDRMLATGHSRWVKLATPLPVRFVYWTATADEGGKVHVHPDIYKRDDDSQNSAGAGSGV